MVAMTKLIVSVTSINNNNDNSINDESFRFLINFLVYKSCIIQ